MIMIINKLIALLPKARQEVFQTRRMAFRGIEPVPMWQDSQVTCWPVAQIGAVA